ncbi:MAG: TetR/AcrR family transcriptional regulator [Anaerorhabdus sp.]
MKENNTKKEVREVAIKLFKKNGFDAITLNDICSAAGISKNTFYYYFSSKEDLLKEKIELSPLSHSSFTDLLLLTSPYDQYKELARQHISHFQQCGKEIMKKILHEKVSGSFSHSSSTDKEDLRRLFELQTSLIQRAQEQKEIMNRSDPKILARAAAAMLIGLFQIWTTDNSITSNIEEEYFVLLDILLQKKED